MWYICRCSYNIWLFVSVIPFYQHHNTCLWIRNKRLQTFIQCRNHQQHLVSFYTHKYEHIFLLSILTELIHPVFWYSQNHFSCCFINNKEVVNLSKQNIQHAGVADCDICGGFHAKRNGCIVYSIHIKEQGCVVEINISPKIISIVPNDRWAVLKEQNTSTSFYNSLIIDKRTCASKDPLFIIKDVQHKSWHLLTD